ncbi:protein disulfide-isomerase precursor [Mortierella sp. GBA30]|nr:protein disulfide-isomerase precursor [Mortierella sp. GBA30]
MRISSAIALVSLATTAMLTGLSQASDVLSLTKDTFASSVSPDQKIILVDFYAPWCGHCKNLEPEYEKAATQLKEDGIPLAKVDCTVDKDLCKDYQVSGYPTLKVFKAGVPKDYKGQRNADGIVSYLKKQAGPPVIELTPETMPAFAASERVVVVAVLPKGSPMRDDVEKIANFYRDDFIFGVVEEHPDVKAPAVVLYKKFDEGKNILEGDFTDARLVNFVRTNCLPTIDDIGPSNYMQYMDSGMPLAYLFFGNAEDRSKYAADIEALAKEMKGKINFVFIDGTKYGAHAANVGLEADKWPAFAVQDVNTAEKFPLEMSPEQPLTIERIREHVKEVFAGIYKAKIKSEAIPESNDGPVKIVVAHTYDEIVGDTTKDVLIEYYAPWCGFCKMLAPIYDEVGALYQGSNIVIAKIDATANDLPTSLPFTIPGYPTIKFRKAGSTEYMDYSGERTKEAFVRFLQKNAGNKVEIDYDPGLKSEVTPETDDGPVKIVVANTYEQIVEDKDKDVMIEFYAPWCGFCKMLAPIYDEVGDHFKGSNIVVAKIDATANDLPKSLPFAVNGYPTIKFRKAGSTEYIDYNGERTKEAFVEFLTTNAVNKLEAKTEEIKQEDAKQEETNEDAPEEQKHDEL